MSRRRTAGLGLLASFALVLSSLVAIASPAQAAATIVPNPSTVADLQVISVSGNAGGPGAPKLYVAMCEDLVPTATNCDTRLNGFGTPTAHILQVVPNPTTGAWGPVELQVRRYLVTGDSDLVPHDCLAEQTCVIGTTNSANPADQTYNATAQLTFVGGAPPIPERTSGPTLSGSVKVGSKVTCSVGYAGGLSTSYGWLRSGAVISGATAATYTPKAVDRGKLLACRSSASNAGGTTGLKVSSAVKVALGVKLVVRTKPVIKGKAKVGNVLRSTEGTWAPKATSFRFQWLRDGKPIKNATKARYQVKKKDRGHKLRVKVTAKRPGHAAGVVRTKVKSVR